VPVKEDRGKSGKGGGGDPAGLERKGRQRGMNSPKNVNRSNIEPLQATGLSSKKELSWGG